MQQETIAVNVLSRFERWILAPLRADVEDPRRSFMVFILISIAIDHLASIRYLGEIPDRERGGVGKRYRKFIETYMPSAYKKHAALLYKGFRCKLVHEFQLREVDIRQDEDSRKKHLTAVEGNRLCLNSREFFAGVVAAFNALRLDMTGAAAKKEIVASFEKSGYKRWILTNPPGA